uniref:Uncharacterized protein n=1 Tax=Rhizophora mucronata TaxID=61149 RepID=A0A2P2PEF3_RHIMU
MGKLIVSFFNLFSLFDSVDLDLKKIIFHKYKIENCSRSNFS